SQIVDAMAPITLANLKRLSIQSLCSLLRLTTPNLTPLSIFPHRVLPHDLQTVQDFVACFTSNFDITSAFATLPLRDSHMRSIKRFCMPFYPEAGQSSATFKLIASDFDAAVEALMEMVAYPFCEYVCVRTRLWTCFAKKGFLVSGRNGLVIEQVIEQLDGKDKN
ncbi:hypothetical protein BDZ89DRAFT_1059182, partial [Hymenopellis radicata]